MAELAGGSGSAYAGIPVPESPTCPALNGYYSRLSAVQSLPLEFTARRRLVDITRQYVTRTRAQEDDWR
jgi:hypothetical protein